MIACQNARDWYPYCWQLQQRLSYTSLLWLPIIVGEFVVQSKHYNDSINMATMPVEPVLLLLQIDPMHCGVTQTHRQTDRHRLFAKICSVLKSCISDSSSAQQCSLCSLDAAPAPTGTGVH